MCAPDSVDWFGQPLHLEGRTMALSKQERHAWNELERVLADDLPYTDATLGQLPADHSQQPNYRALMVSMVLIAGSWILVIGALSQLLPMALTGLVITCIAADHLNRTSIPRTVPEQPEQPERPTPPDGP